MSAQTNNNPWWLAQAVEGWAIGQGNKEIAMVFKRDHARLMKAAPVLSDALLNTAAHLAAAISLLENYHRQCAPAKRHALFGTMIEDYKAALERARTTLGDV